MWPAELTDASVGDFLAGTTDEGAYVARTQTGEVLLAPRVAGEFTGSDLPSGWEVTPFRPAGRGTLEDGMLTLDAARVGCGPLLPSPCSLEFSAVFAARPDQHVGFGTNFVDVPWVMFSTKWGRRLYGRTHLLQIEDRRLDGHWFDRPHVFRIDWNVLDIVFSIDGSALARFMVPIPGFMRALAGNSRLGTDPLRVAWMRVSPFAPCGTFSSRVFDAGEPVDWHPPACEADVPDGTSLVVDVRTGDTPVPDPTWSTWEPDAPATARYLQYRAVLATTDPSRTPVLRRTSVAHSVAGASSRSSGSGSALGCP